MEERTIVFETKEDEIQQMSFGDLILFVSSAQAFLSLENHLSKDLDEEDKSQSIQKMMKVDRLLSLAKNRLDSWS